MGGLAADTVSCATNIHQVSAGSRFTSWSIADTSLNAAWHLPTLQPRPLRARHDRASRRGRQPGWMSRRAKRASPTQQSAAAAAVSSRTGGHDMGSSGWYGVAENGSTSSSQLGRCSASPTRTTTTSPPAHPRSAGRQPWQPAEQRDGDADEDHDRRPVRQGGQRQRSRPGRVTDGRPVPRHRSEPPPRSEQDRGARRRDQQALRAPTGCATPRRPVAAR